MEWPWVLRLHEHQQRRDSLDDVGTEGGTRTVEPERPIDQLQQMVHEHARLCAAKRENEDTVHGLTCASACGEG